MSSLVQTVAFMSFDQLLEAARNGDREAQGRLLETCRLPLLRLARRELNTDLQPKGGGSDLVQETFLKALREIDAFRGCTPQQLLAWLRVILLHTLSNFARGFSTAKRRAASEAPPSPAAIGERQGRRAASPSEALMRREQAEAVRRAVGSLPPHYLEVVRLRQERNLSFAEIGRLTGRSSTAVRKVWMRAAAAIGRELLRSPTAAS
jgi:RNA polymerase sigma-70 factor (ECF subfamily)